MAIIRNSIELLVNPFFLLLFLLGLCVFFLWRQTHPRFVRRALLNLFILLIVISTGWLPQYVTNKLESRYPVVLKADPKIRLIVVLSGGQSEVAGMPVNDLLSSSSIKRLVEGVRLFRALPDATLLLSGGGSVGEYPEADLLAQVAHWFAIPKQRMVLEIHSLNTADQARELAAIIHDKPFYLVTSAIHMPRSMALCQKQGLHPIAAPTDFTFFWNTESWAKMIIPNSYNLAYFNIAMHEVLGRMWASLYTT